MIPFMQLSSQFTSIEGEIRAAVDRVLSSGWYILGRECEAFEEEFAAYVGTRHCVAVNSGTDAITIALRAAGIYDDDRVATVTNTCPPTGAAIVNARAALSLVDCDESLQMAASRIDAAAIVPVHLYGNSAPVDEIVAQNSEAIIIEDCAQAHGGSLHGRACGTIGHAGAYSFYPTKTLGAYGDAGAIVTNDDDIAEAARAYRNYGQEQCYQATEPGVNSRLDELQAGILRVKLKHLSEWVEARRERAARYTERLRDIVTTPTESNGAKHAYHLYVIRTPRRDELRAHFEEQGIGTQIHYPIPLHRQPAFEHAHIPDSGLPNAERACDEVLSLPLYPELSLGDVDRVCDAVEGFFA